MYNLILLCGCLYSVCGFNFDVYNVEEIRGNNNSYFGYSLLLQKGSRPSVVVGAPRQNSGHNGGSVFSCTLGGLCTKYTILASSINSFNGNYLGSALDGDENVGDQLVVCAPRVVKAIGDVNFLNGLCFSKKNSSSYGTPNLAIKPLDNLPPISRDIASATSYYDNGFGEAGLDVHYLEDTKQVLLGAPGIKNWNGAMVLQSLSNTAEYKIIPERRFPVFTENAGYLGYKVTSARFEATRQNVWYVGGAPRGSKLFGNVKIFNSARTLQMTLTGNEIGSYFGSTILAVDVNNDRIDDLLVGAPMGSGTTWDEGYVYFYKSSRTTLENPIKLVGAKKVGGRFGTSIVSLGDIDLDSFNDVAISAPYEDNGVGAVYIYMGSKSGINVIYSQKLSPKEFSPNFGLVKGFGQGLSRGVDVDGNGHNDLAVGAYKSDQVFILKTISVIDFSLYLDSNVSSISSNSMNVIYCVHYTQRSKTQDLRTVTFITELLLDYRVVGETNITDTLQVDLSQRNCKSLDIKIKQSSLDISPFKMTFKSRIQESNVIGKGENQLEKLIPYSHGCGDDNICQTQILIEAITTTPQIVLGLNKEISVNVSAENVGEPGYGCELHLNFPSVLELRDTRDCDLENSTYVCPFSTRLISRKETQFKFDIKLRNPDMDKVVINFELKCLGENSPPDANKHSFPLHVLLRNSPYIQGSSDPGNLYLSDENVVTDLEISHTFKIGNSGPSPVKLDVFLLLPLAKQDGVDIFKIDAKGSLNGIEVQCYPTNKTLKYENSIDVQSLLTESLNRTIVVDCFEEGKECLKLFCDGKYLYKSTEIAQYNLKITANRNLLVSHYQAELLNKDIIAYISTAYLYNSANTRVESYATTQILASSKKPVPLWIYIAGGVIGALLLALVIFLLYKCHFFDRNYRDKLNDEKLIEQNIEEVAEPQHEIPELPEQSEQPEEPEEPEENSKSQI